MRRVLSGGYTLLELLFAVAIAATLTGVALPLTSDAIDAQRTMMAARYVSGRIAEARMQAIMRSASVALKFDPGSPDYRFAAYIDGNHNGVRTTDIRSGLDRAVTAAEHIGDNFPAVRFELMADLPDVDGARNTGTDGVRIGSARILTMSANGTATAGTLYLRGRRAQYAVRVLGTTGRTRVLQYHTGDRKWINR
jgi:Tfp pilus assembly protein FimT